MPCARREATCRSTQEDLLVVPSLVGSSPHPSQDLPRRYRVPGCRRREGSRYPSGLTRGDWRSPDRTVGPRFRRQGLMSSGPKPATCAVADRTPSADPDGSATSRRKPRDSISPDQGPEQKNEGAGRPPRERCGNLIDQLLGGGPPGSCSSSSLILACSSSRARILSASASTPRLYSAVFWFSCTRATAAESPAL